MNYDGTSISDMDLNCVVIDYMCDRPVFCVASGYNQIILEYWQKTDEVNDLNTRYDTRVNSLRPSDAYMRR